MIAWLLYGLSAGIYIGLFEAGWDCLLKAIQRDGAANAICDMYPIYLDTRAGPDVDHAVRIMDAHDFAEDAGLILQLEERSTN